MNLTNEGTKQKYSAMTSLIEQLRGGFGNDDRDVGSSYHYFYIDQYQGAEGLSEGIRREEAAYESIRSIQVDALCNKAASLIKQVKDFPML